MQESKSPDEAADWDLLLGLAGRLVYGGSDHAVFLEQFRHAAPALAPGLFDGGKMPPEDAQRMAGALGFAIWRSMPHPDHHWRPAPAPLPGRNEPCYCGSGQKFKRCCASLPMPTSIFERFNLLRYLLDSFPATRFDEIPRERLDPLALADTAQQWLTEGDEQRAAQLLEPLFQNPGKLDARHENAFDVLMAAWLTLDRPRKRKMLIDALMEHSDPDLATAARQRKVTMLADQGDWDGAWSLFQTSLRRTPDHPQFAHLEVTLLTMQGREDEARSRAEFWSQRLRKLDPDYADYAEVILELARDPAGVLAADEAAASPLFMLWSSLVDGAPVPATAHEVHTSATVMTLEPARELASIERQWRRRFPVPKPMLTSLDGDPQALLDNVTDLTRFLQEHPLAWQSFDILDDLALAAHWMARVEAVGPPWFALQRRLAERAEALLSALLPEALAPPVASSEEAALVDPRLMAGIGADDPRLPWVVFANRPALRLVALQIDARMSLRPADPRTPGLMAWMIRLNPDDNHGYRTLLAQRWLRESQPEAALALMERYSDDIGPVLADRLLALLALERQEEAAALLAAEGAWIAEIRHALLARTYRRPRELDGGYVSVGGRGEAWIYREDMRATWERTGGLRWLAAQPAPKAGPKAAARAAGPPGQPIGRRTPAIERDATAAIASGRERFVQFGGDPVFAHGLLVAKALAPDIASASPSGWISLLLKPSDEFTPAFTDIDDANRVLGGFTAWYNAILDEIGPAARGGPRAGVLAKPWLDEPTSRAVSRWAAGFMAFVGAEPAAWRRLGSIRHLDLLAPLRKLAAQAPLSAAEKADPSRVSDRADDGAPLLSLVDDGDPVALLVHALERLVEAVGLLRSGSRVR